MSLPGYTTEWKNKQVICHGKGSLGSRLWGGVYCSGYLLKSILAINIWGGRMREGELERWCKPNSSLSHAIGGLESRKVILSCPKVGQHGKTFIGLHWTCIRTFTLESHRTGSVIGCWLCLERARPRSELPLNLLLNESFGIQRMTTEAVSKENEAEGCLLTAFRPETMSPSLKRVWGSTSESTT